MSDAKHTPGPFNELDRENVARAICAAKGINPDEPVDTRRCKITWQLWLQEADAALIAMQPTHDAQVAALEKARHKLVTLHNLRVTDLSEELFDAHLRNGVPRHTIEWMADCEPELAEIDAVLARMGTVIACAEVSPS